ncbi:MAG: hypothetical protein J1D87_12395 [Lachnospiraceae bacterium]|nr:hypothetical protein [Lachnospiraceae bacterium]
MGFEELYSGRGEFFCRDTWYYSSGKLQLPKLAGLGGGMPHHAECREKIIVRLSSLN